MTLREFLTRYGRAGDVAELTGFSVSYITKIISGDMKRLSLHKRKTFAEALSEMSGQEVTLEQFSEMFEETKRSKNE